VDLLAWRPQRSLRRTLTRLRERADVIITPAVLDAEKEELYRRYRAARMQDRPDSLYSCLVREEHRENLGLFDTWQVELRQSGRLIGYSLFDLGHDSMMSLMGIWDPEAAELSLGLATMALEVEWGQQRGMRWHYPGYVVPGQEVFAYKTRLQPLEWLNEQSLRWEPWETFRPDRLAGERLHPRLTQISELLTQRGLPHRPLMVAPWRSAWVSGAEDRYLSSPLVMELLCARPPYRLIFSVDLHGDGWELRAFQAVADLRDRFDPEDLLELGPHVETQLLARASQPLATDALSLDALFPSLRRDRGAEG
jgi:arginine-tRNA-protein transferase